MGFFCSPKSMTVFLHSMPKLYCKILISGDKANKLNLKYWNTHVTSNFLRKDAILEWHKVYLIWQFFFFLMNVLVIVSVII